MLINYQLSYTEPQGAEDEVQCTVYTMTNKRDNNIGIRDRK